MFDDDDDDDNSDIWNANVLELERKRRRVQPLVFRLNRPSHPLWRVLPSIVISKVRHFRTLPPAGRAQDDDARGGNL